jgi:hypothetical protein
MRAALAPGPALEAHELLTVVELEFEPMIDGVPVTMTVVSMHEQV